MGRYTQLIYVLIVAAILGGIIGVLIKAGQPEPDFNKQRREKLKHIPDTYKKTAVYFVVSLETALKRNTQRPGKVIPPEILERMIKEYELKLK